MGVENTQVLIVGAGPAGLSAALELNHLGVSGITVVDREPEAGGIPRLCHHIGFGLGDLHRLYSGPQYARRYVQGASARGITVHTSTTVTDWNGSTSLVYTSPRGLGEIKAQAVLLATGCRERPRAARLIPGTRPQGIFTTGSLQRFVDEHQLPVGENAVIVGAELVSLSAFMTLQYAGLKVAAMVTELPKHQIYFPFLPVKWLLVDLIGRTPIYGLSRIVRVLGYKRVEGVEIVNLETGRQEVVACDTLVFSGDWIPEDEIARSGGLAIDGGTHGPQVDVHYRTSQQGVFAAGNLLRGAETADRSALEGRQAARQIHNYLQNNNWPVHSLPVQVEPPLVWVFPNNVSGTSEQPSSGHLSFRVQSFIHNTSVQVHQGEKVLHRQTFRRLVPNQTMRLAANWLGEVDMDGELLKIAIGE